MRNRVGSAASLGPSSPGKLRRGASALGMVPEGQGDTFFPDPLSPDAPGEDSRTATTAAAAATAGSPPEAAAPTTSGQAASAASSSAGRKFRRVAMAVVAADAFAEAGLRGTVGLSQEEAAARRAMRAAAAKDLAASAFARARQESHGSGGGGGSMSSGGGSRRGGVGAGSVSGGVGGGVGMGVGREQSTGDGSHVGAGLLLAMSAARAAGHRSITVHCQRDDKLIAWLRKEMHNANLVDFKTEQRYVGRARNIS